jgi:hypothetical protein
MGKPMVSPLASLGGKKQTLLAPVTPSFANKNQTLRGKQSFPLNNPFFCVFESFFSI